MPENTVYVGRGSKWGNPFKAGENKAMQRSDGVCVFFYSGNTEAAVANFRVIYNNDNSRADVRAALAGKNLACWCPIDQPCHADVLLEIANEASK